jgi:hypothetical protein
VAGSFARTFIVAKTRIIPTPLDAATATSVVHAIKGGSFFLLNLDLRPKNTLSPP